MAVHTDIRSVNEAEQIQKRDGRDEIQVQLPAELGLGLGVELDEGMAESGALGQRLDRRPSEVGRAVSLIRGGSASLGGGVMVAAWGFFVVDSRLVGGVHRGSSLLVGHGGGR